MRSRDTDRRTTYYLHRARQTHARVMEFWSSLPFSTPVAAYANRSTRVIIRKICGVQYLPAVMIRSVELRSPRWFNFRILLFVVFLKLICTILYSFSLYKSSFL